MKTAVKRNLKFLFKIQLQVFDLCRNAAVLILVYFYSSIYHLSIHSYPDSSNLEWWTFKNKMRLILVMIVITFIYSSIVDVPAGIYLLKVNKKNTRTRWEICSELTIKTQERRQWRRSDVFIVNFEHISHLIQVFLLLTLNM